MDGIQASSKPVIVLAATNRPNSLDPALRRPGRFDREIEIGIPNPAQRLEILKAQIRKIPHALSAADVEAVAEITHGYVGADLSMLCREAALLAMTESRALESAHFIEALKKIRPSAMREVYVQVPHVKWTDIGGQHVTKQKLRESVELPLKHPEVFKRFGISPPKGVLLYGPPGCSKTLIAKALATEAKLNFLAVKGPEVFSKWVGESERAIREVFRKARASSPSILFFDEIDAIGSKRGDSGEANSVNERVLSQMLNEMDGIESLLNVTVVAATNRPDILDSALLRPGRFDRLIYVPPPDYEARLEIFKIKTRKMPVSSNVDFSSLAACTEGYSGAEISAICQEAALIAIDENMNADAVTAAHFESAVSACKPRISKDMIQFYENYRAASI